MTTAAQRIVDRISRVEFYISRDGKGKKIAACYVGLDQYDNLVTAVKETNGVDTAPWVANYAKVGGHYVIYHRCNEAVVAQKLADGQRAYRALEAWESTS